MSNHERAFAYYARKAPRQWFHITNGIGDETAKVFLYDAIGGLSGVSASEFVQALNDIDADVIEVHINCPGGSVYDGIAIMNALRQHPARVVSFVDGLAASAASCIAVGGAEEVVMAENAELMIHDAWGACMGDAAEMQRMADDLERISSNIASVYARKAGGDVPQWRSAMLAETWYSADEAVVAGLADRVDRAPDEDDESAEASAVAGNRSSKARWNLDYYEHAGRDHAPAPFMPAARYDKGGALPSGISTVRHTTGRAEPVQKHPSASAAGFTPPNAPASGDTSQNGVAVAFSDHQLTTMRQSLGVPNDADEQTIVDALNEALDERAGGEPSNSIPEGSVLVDQGTFDEMRADASAGREARTQQETERRTTLVQAAVRDGRIPPARREAWVNMLASDPGAEETLAALRTGTIPVDEIGHGNPTGPHSAEPGGSEYQALYGAPSTEEA